MPGENRLSPKEVTYLLDELSVKLLEDQEIYNEWKKWVRKYENENKAFAYRLWGWEAVEKNPVTREDRNGIISNYGAPSRALQERYQYEYGIESITQARPFYSDGHYANNRQDLYNMVRDYLKLSDEDKKQMPLLGTYLRSIAPAAVNFKVEHQGYPDLIELRGSGVSVYLSDPGSNTILSGYGITPEEYNSSIERIKQAAAENTIRSDVAYENFERVAPKKDILSDGAEEIQRIYESRPKTTWWHKKPAEDSAVRKAEKAYEDLMSFMNLKGVEDFTLLKEKLEAARDTSLAYLNEKDNQKGVDLNASMADRLSENADKRTAFGAGRYEAFWKINEYCNKKLKAIEDALQSDEVKKAGEKVLQARKIEKLENEQWKEFDELYRENIGEIEKLNEQIWMKENEADQKVADLNRQLEKLRNDLKIQNKVQDEVQKLSNENWQRIKLNLLTERGLADEYDTLKLRYEEGTKIVDGADKYNIDDLWRQIIKLEKHMDKVWNESEEKKNWEQNERKADEEKAKKDGLKFLQLYYKDADEQFYNEFMGRNFAQEIGRLENGIGFEQQNINEMEERRDKLIQKIDGKNLPDRYDVLVQVRKEQFEKEQALKKKEPNPWDRDGILKNKMEAEQQESEVVSVSITDLINDIQKNKKPGKNFQRKVPTQEKKKNLSV